MQIIPATSSAFLNFGSTAQLVAPGGIMLNPDFNTGPVNGTSWMCSGNATIANGKANFIGGGGGGFFYQPHGNYIIQPTISNNYILSFYINPGSVGQLRVVLNNTSTLDTSVSGTGLYSFPFTYTGGDSTFNFQDLGFTGSVEWCQISANPNPTITNPTFTAG